MNTEECLRNSDFVASMTSMISEDPERVRNAVNATESNRAMNRFVRVAGQDKQIQGIVGKTKKRDKMKIYKAAKNAGNTRPTSGIVCVSVRTNGLAKKVFYPAEDKRVDFENERLTPNLGYLRSTLGGRRNKAMTDLTPDVVNGDVIIYACTEDSLEPNRDLLQEEFDALYPNLVFWK